ncbi:hypothetical protein ABNX05_11425 [Lysinibacillus sp. M3]|uniref:Uncharacterized protein n=1 Tax=Lysinibacillus zambalensis TaxID=3160866 RepID=A0ABV1MUE5_9BACI
MITRKELHNHIGFKERVRGFISVVINKLNLNPTTPLPTTKLKFEKWKCEPLHNGISHFITVCNDDIEESLRGIEMLNGKVIEMVKKSEDEYRIEFKNNRVYKLSRYI